MFFSTEKKNMTCKMHGGRLHVGGRIQRTEGLMRVSRPRKERSAEASDSVKICLL